MTNYDVKKIIWYVTGTMYRAMGASLKKPIFVVATGRCGSTLLGRILNSNKQLSVYHSEANELWHPRMYPPSRAAVTSPTILQDPKRFTEISVARWPASQKHIIKSIFTGFQKTHHNAEPFITISAMTSFMMPTMLDIFPDARFIHIYRNGIPMVESLFKKLRTKHPDYSKYGDQELRSICAGYWNSCILEVDRVRQSLELDKKNSLFEVSYEALCDDTQGVLTSLANYIGTDPRGFTYDLSKIHSMNYKVGDYEASRKWSAVADRLRPAMDLKHYF